MFLNCLVCNSSNLSTLKGYEKDHLVSCASCHFVFSSHIPTIEELQEEYQTTYTRSDAISQITLSRYPELLDYFEKYRVTNNIIDVGCGNGHFIKAAKDRGWNVYGTEFDERAVNICIDKGIDMQQGKFNSANYNKDFFDVITSFEVIEHINNPKEEVTAFKSVLRSGGLVYVTTPNYASISRRVLKHRWTIFNYPEHLSYFSPKSIKKLFIDTGFTVLKIQTTGFNYGRFRSSLKRNVQHQEVTSNNELIRNVSERGFGKFIKDVVNLSLNLFKLGDKLKAEFVKKL